MKTTINLLLPALFLSTAYLPAMDNKKFVDPNQEEKSKTHIVTSNYQELDETHYKMIYESAPEEFKEIVENQNKPVPYMNNVFLYGPAGTGKTSLGLTAALILKRPYFILDAAHINNLLKKLISFLKNKEKVVIIIDEINTLTNGNREDLIGTWKTLDSCFKAMHLFFVLTANDPSKMPLPLKDRVLYSAVKIITPSPKLLIELLIQKLKNTGLLNQETENYIKNHPDLSFVSYRNVEGFFNHILLEIKHQNRSNSQSQSPITKILIDSIVERNKKNLKEFGHFAPDISEQE